MFTVEYFIVSFVCVSYYRALSLLINVAKGSNVLCLFISSLGHGLVLQEGFAAPSDHLGRRLMATVGDNETEFEKNCTEPGNAICLLSSVWR